MAANPYHKSIELDGASWFPAADESIVLNVTIVVPAGNSAPDVNVRVDRGPAQAWPKDTEAPLVGVDISRLEFSGTVGDRVLIVGNTR